MSSKHFKISSDSFEQIQDKLLRPEHDLSLFLLTCATQAKRQAGGVATASCCKEAMIAKNVDTLTNVAIFMLIYYVLETAVVLSLMLFVCIV